MSARLSPPTPLDAPVRLRGRIGPWMAPLWRHRRALLPVLLIWMLAALKLFADPTPRLPLLFNVTPSLPYHLLWLRQDGAPLQRGDLVVYRFEGPAQASRPGLSGQPFFKIVRGLPGDRITVDGRTVSINGTPVGLARTHSADRQPLEPIAATVIPADHYYMQGSSPDSFDSRYLASGLVRADQVIGKVLPLW